MSATNNIEKGFNEKIGIGFSKIIEKKAMPSRQAQVFFQGETLAHLESISKATDMTLTAVITQMVEFGAAPLAKNLAATKTLFNDRPPQVDELQQVIIELVAKKFNSLPLNQSFEMTSIISGSDWDLVLPLASKNMCGRAFKRLVLSGLLPQIAFSHKATNNHVHYLRVSDE